MQRDKIKMEFMMVYTFVVLHSSSATNLKYTTKGEKH